MVIFAHCQTMVNFHRWSFPTSVSMNHFYIFTWWGPRFFCHLVPSVTTNRYQLDRAVLYGLALVALIGVGHDQWTFAIISEHRTRPYISAPLHPCGPHMPYFPHKTSFWAC